MTASRSYLICHMMCSLDGKITSGTGQYIFDDQYLGLYDQTDQVLKTQGWMCGRVTMEMFAESVDTPLPAATTSPEVGDYLSSHLLNKFCVAADTHGSLRWKSNVIHSSFGGGTDYSLIVLVTDQTPGEYLLYLRTKNIPYLTVGKNEVEWQLALEKLKKFFGIDRLSLQGGGKINGSLLKANCIDELSLLMIPLAVNNSAAPNLFENEVTPATFTTYGFDLKEVKQLEKNVVWLRYLATTAT